MAMRVSGINSGLDTDAIVQELVSAYSKKTEKYEKEQTKLSWKQDAWKSLNSKVYSLYTDVSNLRYSSAYAIKKTTSSDTTKATVSASGSAVNGTHKLNILQTAQSAYLTGAKVYGTTSGDAVTSETTLKDLGIMDDASIQVKTKDENGKEVVTKIDFTADSTIADVTNKLAGAGLNASFDENQGRFYISSKTTGSAGNFEISAADTVKVAKKDPVTGEIIKEKDEKGIERVVWTEIDASAETRAASNNLLSVLGLGGDSTRRSGNAITDKSGNVGVASNTSLRDLGYIAGADGFSFTVNYEKDGTTYSKEIKLNTDTRLNQTTSAGGKSLIEQLNDQLADAGITAVLSSDGIVFSGEGTDTLSFSTADGDASSAEVLKSLGLSNGLNEVDTSRNPKKIDGQDAIIVLDGVTYTNNTNSFSINGLNITANGVTDDVFNGESADVSTLSEADMQALADKVKNSTNTVTINTTTDTQGLYDKIKDFLTEYNAIINEITKLYNADSAYDYEPLTDDEKDAMSDTEIEKWETKIKDSLLRRDSSLNSLMSSMINAMNQAITINGKTYSLSSFGIQTLGYLNAVENEQNAFHIDGDEEDENTSGNEDKLMAAINSDPDTVVEFMKQLTSNLYSAIDSNMQSNSLRSRYKIYNDKELETQYNNYTKTISEWEEKVSDKEDYYYKQFSNMESALSKLNSQSSSLSSMLG